MNKEEIMRMAREAGFATSWTEAAGEALERFAALVEERTHTNNKARWYQEGVEAEREACAKLCEQWNASHPDALAAAIRARS